MKIETELAITQHVAVALSGVLVAILICGTRCAPPPARCEGCYQTVAIEPIPVHVEITMKEPVVQQAQSATPTIPVTTPREAGDWPAEQPGRTLPSVGSPSPLIFGGPQP